MSAYTANENATAVRCVDCPSCGARTGMPCHHISKLSNGDLIKVTAHKRRVDKFYVDTYGPDSPAVNEMFKATPVELRTKEEM